MTTTGIDHRSLSLSVTTKYSYGVGHVMNDLCASMWFSYLLLFFQNVLCFDESSAGVILLIGQLADGFSTPLVGYFADKENTIAGCAKYGRRKIWHLIGTICIALSFPFIFSGPLGIGDEAQSVKLTYYSFFVVIFQFGWASVQISHLSLIPELTCKKHTRTELNSIRYAFTVISNLIMFIVAFLFLSEWIGDGEDSTTNITSSDLTKFRNMAIFAICAGSAFSFIFHVGVKEPPFATKSQMTRISNGKMPPSNLNLNMKLKDWFKEIAFYQIALLYMATRLYVNLYQVYIPFYVEQTLKLDKTAVATMPFTIYLSGFIGSLVMKQINKKIGRKMTFILGSGIGLMGCLVIAFGHSAAYKTWGVYCAGFLLGVGGSTVLITSLSLTADFIGDNVEGGAFVYGLMSFVDKISNGLVIMAIQKLYNSKQCYYKHVIVYACGGSCILGIIISLSLIPIRVSERRGVSKKVLSIEDGKKSTACTEFPASIIYDGKLDQNPQGICNKVMSNEIMEK